MLVRNIAIGWIVAFTIAVMLVSVRVVVPGLINLQNDGALICAFLIAGLTVTLPFVVWFQIIKPLTLNQEL